MIERTFVIIKPDAIQRGITGDIITRFERVGLKVVGAKMIQVPEELANKHYPKNREEFIKGMGQKTLDNYKERGIDAKKELGSEDPKVIGAEIQKWLVEFLMSSPVLAWCLRDHMQLRWFAKFADSLFLQRLILALFVAITRLILRLMPIPPNAQSVTWYMPLAIKKRLILRLLCGLSKKNSMITTPSTISI